MNMLLPNVPQEEEVSATKLASACSTAISTPKHASNSKTMGRKAVEPDAIRKVVLEPE